jgi:REP element-mobilizing transposase RayT
MNRGYEGRKIFLDERDKAVFLEILSRAQKATRIRLLAYCIMGNHYHVVLQNTTGHMPMFFRQLNGRYAAHFRRRHGGRGYVFQERYKSMLIQDDGYLKVAIAYVLGNPVRAHLAEAFDRHSGSSGILYFNGAETNTVDVGFVEDLFGSRTALQGLVDRANELPVIQSELGPIIGSEEFSVRAAWKAERRSGRESLERRRSPDKYFDPLEKIIGEFEKKHGVETGQLDMTTHAGKKLRAELLVHLKDRSGMTYRAIVKLEPFADLEMSGLGTLYQRSKKRLDAEKTRKG